MVQNGCLEWPMYTGLLDPPLEQPLCNKGQIEAPASDWTKSWN